MYYRSDSLQPSPILKTYVNFDAARQDCLVQSYMHLQQHHPLLTKNVATAE